MRKKERPTRRRIHGRRIQPKRCLPKERRAPSGTGAGNLLKDRIVTHVEQKILCALFCPLRGIRQKWQRKLQLGCRRTGNDNDSRRDDVVRAVHPLRCRLGFRSRCRAPDLYQNEHRRVTHGEVHRINFVGARPSSLIPIVFPVSRLPHIGG